MGVKILLDYFEEQFSAERTIDLIQVAKNLSKDGSANKMKSDAKLTLVIDGESCLNRLYGGFYSDWICGGQWNRMAAFICDLVSKMNEAKIEIVVFFNGALEPQRMNEWICKQREEYFNMQKILNILNTKPPSNRLWTPPVGLRSAIRMKLREMNVNVISTIDDHRQEVIAYCRENNIYGLIADDAEYVAFHPKRLFSAMQLKLRYRGSLETKEFRISDFMEKFNLNSVKLCVLAALLGNYLLSDEELQDVYKKADIDVTVENIALEMISKLANYVNQLKVTTDLGETVQEILGAEDSRSKLLKQSIQYYLNGTKDGFLKYHSVSTAKSEKSEFQKESVDMLHEPDLDTTALASEKAGTDKNILNEYDQASACLESEQEDMKVTNFQTSDNSVDSCDSKSNDESSKQNVKEEKISPVLPHVSHEVMRTLSERHSKGLMSPYIYQILSQGEIKLPVVMENGTDVPNIYAFYKPIRQMVYAIVFNLHHHKYIAAKENKPLEVDISIKEWVFNKVEKVHKPEYVKAEPVGWGVPTIQRLWFGTLQDDKRRRLRAFLTCMRSDVQLILNPDFVPQELLMTAVVLRYIMSFPEKRILRKQELDAFIVTALTLNFQDPHFLQNLKDPISKRNVQLAVLFMKGVEMALLVNDACGAPIPWLMCCPWLFFDGKLFNNTFQKAIKCKNLQELCGSRLGIVVSTERMRQAILEGLNVQFARPPIPSLISNVEANQSFQHGGLRMRNNPPLPANLNRSVPGDNPRNRRSFGGRLEIAGVVVGSWGANYNVAPQSYETSPYLVSPPQPQVSTITGSSYNNYGYRSRSAFNTTPKGKSFKFYSGKKKIVKKDRKPGRGRGMTIGSSSNTVTDTDTDLLNGNDTNIENTKSEIAVVNGEASSKEEDDGSTALNSMSETSSCLVQAVSK